MPTGGASLPTGVVTFLLTDVESSTALWDRNAAGMSRALQLHDETIDAAVSAAGGSVLKARGEGDSTFSVFSRPTEAVRAALTARRALEVQDWPGFGVRLTTRPGSASCVLGSPLRRHERLSFDGSDGAEVSRNAGSVRC